MRASASLLVVALLSGCATAPHYARPETPAVPAFKEQGPWITAGTDLPATGEWWHMFGDATLDTLIPRVETGSPSLAAAVARYDQATAQVRRERADLLPSVNAGADAERARVSAGRPPTAPGAATYSDRSLGASLSYELDLFGRIRNSVRQASASAQASEADVAATKLALQTRLASIYFDLRGLDARLALLRESVAAFQRAYDLTSTRHGGGIASGLDVSRAATILANARAELDGVAAARARDEHAIAILIGEAPANFSLPVVDRLIDAPAIPVGLPSTLLQRRPDLVAAERRVAAANAGIGVARAALFPRVTLGGQAGFETIHGDILSAANSFWALGPLSAVASIFDGGARHANLRVARAEFDETAALYRGAVLDAFREVEDNLATARILALQERNQLDAANAAERTRDLAMTRYRDGASDYLEVVTAQTAALDARRALLITQTAQLAVTTDMVRALGGGYSQAL
jgi:multidrug efflux system outer membrane protein